ncbi:beta-1,6-N-acetylglucosaminyltransferase [Anditalea andensis]|uniref:Peptide O-xylosyltransferase n=1 Tax=Anditalea andensis TaxID=1048983 RepID=A0A074L3Y9_9BACT|nr:beta-1,6-N-acetylglucosaminyltransferase [Anditalea andensis]KEO75145.1 glycosyl transferase [Anditalea andensis]
MKIAHLIIAHNAPHQLKRLVQSLQHKDVDIFISIDLKTDISPFLIFEEFDNVFFIKKRINVYWGDYSLVQSTLIGFEEILSSGRDYGFLNFISGSDYPLTSPDLFIEFLKKEPNTAFMEYYPIEDEWQEAIPRIRNYHLGYFRIKGMYTIQKLMNAVLPKRVMPYQMIAVGRSQWFTLPMACVRYILDFLRQNPKVERYFKMVWGSDEIIFQTILYNSPFKSILKNDNLRYIDWTAGGVSPKQLTMEDRDDLQQSGKFFARKFNMDLDAVILDVIDRDMLIKKKI